MKTEWNLKHLYDSINDPQIEKDIQKDQKNVEEFVKRWKRNKEYTKKPQILAKALKEYDNLMEDFLNPYFYFSLLLDLDQTDEETKKEYNKIQSKYTKIQNEIVFFSLSLTKITKKNQEIFLQAPELKDYKHYLESIFAKSKYAVSEKEQKVFNIMSKTSSFNWANMLEELLNKQTLNVIDEDRKKKEIAYNEITKYLRSKDKKVRDTAANEFCRINDKYSEIAEFELNSILENKKNNDEYRKIKRPDMPRHLQGDIDTDIVDTLIETVEKHYDISKRFYRLKAKKLGQKTLGYHERGVPIGNNDEKYPYDESMKLVKKVFKDLNPEFEKIVSDFEKNGNYDVYPKKGKSGGAYCATISKTSPVYILLNHKDTLSDVTTIAHESGHGIHAILSKQQNALNCSKPISLAEVASTFFEDFVLEEILENTNDEETRKAILFEKINDSVSTIFRQIAGYQFEQELHEKFREEGFLSKDTISKMFTKHMHAYLGDSVDIDKSMNLGWIYWSHFRRPFYVYSYASGLLISKGLQSLVRENPKNIQKVKEFLSSGGLLSPKEVFMKVGIDITKKDFWERGLKEIDQELTLLEKEYD